MEIGTLYPRTRGRSQQMVMCKKSPEDIKEASRASPWKEAFQAEETADAKSRDLIGCLECPKITKDATHCGNFNQETRVALWVSSGIRSEGVALGVFQR